MSNPIENQSQIAPLTQQVQSTSQEPGLAQVPPFPSQNGATQINIDQQYPILDNAMDIQGSQEMDMIQNPSNQTRSCQPPLDSLENAGQQAQEPASADQLGSSHLMQQQIEQQLIQADRESLDSGSTSNMNLDSGTLKDKQGGIGTKNLNNRTNQIDYFQNFDYDKNHSKIKDDVEHYPEPPSFLLGTANAKKNNNQSEQQSKEPDSQIQDQKQDALEKMKPQVQESEAFEESEPKQGKRTQGLPQPYDSTVYYDFKDFPDFKWEPYKNEAQCPASSYYDARNVENNGEKMERLLKGGVTKPILFDLQNTWLKGEQYAHILQNQDRYCKVFGIQKYECKQHPESIYIDPQDGLLYFVEGATIGSDFGFPRLGIRKRFKWKKMNFTTDLPKRDPLVSYIVASAVKCEKFFPGSNDDGPVYRMHAVILKKRDKTLQLPSKGDNSHNSNQKNEGVNSQESVNTDRGNEQQPRSLHGRVLTKSTKLKASERNATSQSKNKQGSSPGNNQASNMDDFDNKNYILCHVRRVMGKRDDEFDSDNPDAESPLKKESSLSPFDQHRQSSKIPNKGKSKLEQIPFNFSETEIQNSSQKDRKMPNLRMFQGMSYDQIKKMKVGPDGKPLSLYKIKKYILPFLSHQLMNESSQQKEDLDLGEVSSEGNQKIDIDNNLKHSQQQSQSRGRKRKNAVPIHELEEEVSTKPGKDDRFHQDHHKDEDDVVEPLNETNKDQLMDQTDKQINVEMLDGKQPPITKQETFNNSQRVGDANDGHNQNLNQLIDQEQSGMTSNNQMNIGNQNQFQLEQALALQNLLGGNNNFGLNNLGLQNTLGGVNGLMFNQLGALQNLGAQGQNGLNSLLSNPNNLGLNSDIALQNQLLGLQGNLGLNSFGGGNYGLNNINNLLGINQLQGVNLNLLGQNPLNNIQLQQSLLGQNGPNNQLLSKIQDQLKMNQQDLMKLNNIGNLGNMNNEIFLMNQQQNNTNNRLSGDHQGNNQMKKRESKQIRKHESLKAGEFRKNSAISPNLIAAQVKDPLASGISPQLKNVGGNLLGLGGIWNGSNMQNNSKRKQTQEQSNPFMDELLTNDLLRHCEKEYSRRLSGQIKLNLGDDQKSQNSPKSNNLSNLMKSPDIQPITQKLAEHLNSQIMQQNMLNKNRKTSMVSNFGRNRLNSNVSAFKKYDSRQSKEKNDPTTSPLIAGKHGEPSFGVESIQESKSVTTLRPPKNSVEGQPSSKKIEQSKLLNQNNKGGKNGGNSNNSIQQQLLQLQQTQQYQQLFNQLPAGQNLDQIQMNLNQQLNNHFGNALQANANNSSQPGDLNGVQNQIQNGGRGANNNSQNFMYDQGQSHQIKNGINGGYQQSQQNGQQNLLFQNQQLPQLLQYHQQQYNMVMNQLVNNQLNIGNNNFNPLNLLQQQNMFANANGPEKTDPKNGVSQTKHGNDNQQINQQINIIQNSKIQPVLSGLIFNQLGAGQNGATEGFGALTSGQLQNRKDSYQKSKNQSSQQRSPRLGDQVRSRKHSQAQFLNQIKLALAPNPTAGGGNQVLDSMLSGNHFASSSQVIPPPSKQHSHRNSNISTSNVMMNLAPRESTDLQYNKHKFSITGAVINSHSNPYNQPKNSSRINQPSQLSNTSNKGGTQSQPISQDNRKATSPDRNLDSNHSQKQDNNDRNKQGDNLAGSFLKMGGAPGPQQSQNDLMKSGKF